MLLPAQQDNIFQIPTTNPRARIEQQIAGTTVTVTYNRPVMRNRKIFGELVPYGKVWRTGADAATRISLSTPVHIEDVSIPAGEYELFTIPDTSSWTIILQPKQGQWGSYRFDPANDILRVSVKPEKLIEPVESFTISIDQVERDRAILHIAWEHVRVPIRIHVDLRETVLPGLEDAITNSDKPPYFLAAMFYFENDLDIDRAEELMALALKSNPDHLGMLYRYALILEKQGNKTAAISAAEKSLYEADKATPELSAEYIRLNTELLKRLKQD